MTLARRRSRSCLEIGGHRMVPTSLLLTCDVSRENKCCAIHKLRWKNNEEVPDEPSEKKKKKKEKKDEGVEEEKEMNPPEIVPEEEVPAEENIRRLPPRATEMDEMKEYKKPSPTATPPGQRLSSRHLDAHTVFYEDDPEKLSEPSQKTRRTRDLSVRPTQFLGRMNSRGGLGVPPPLLIRRNSSATSSTCGDQQAGEWGFYEDCDFGFSRESTSRLDVSHEGSRVTPEYVLEDSLEYQALWHSTNGKRPPQPPSERQKYEALWAQNFARSEVDYPEPPQVPEPAPAPVATRESSTTGVSLALRGAAAAGSSTDLAAGSATSHGRNPHLPPPPSTETPHVVPLLREQSPFGTSATKSWECPGCGELSSMMIHIPKYQIVQEGAFDIHAEYLVVVRLRFVTFGLWRRFKDFERLADSIVATNRPLEFENTLGSWRCVKRRQKWFRCLDKDYVVLKCFLLERFLHDAVFESTSSELFHEFLEIHLPDDDTDDP